VDELVVLLDVDNAPVGTMPKSQVHGPGTPYHYAFSCYLFDPGERKVLFTRRALTKGTWPGVWTNSQCGHPAPGEALEDAAARRAKDELGVRIEDARVVLPTFSYRAVDLSGVVEHEFCPVLVATLDDDPAPDPAEVCDWAWLDWSAAVELARLSPALISPWAAEQIPQLDDAFRVLRG
jgi:isopentenyl-diphosphate delta-isomerase